MNLRRAPVDAGCDSVRTLAALHLDLILRPCHDALAKFARWATEDPACRWAVLTGEDDD